MGAEKTLTSAQNHVFILIKILLFCFVFVSPYANKVDPALIFMVIMLLILIIPATHSLIMAKRPLFEVLLFLPMLLISIAVGFYNGHIPTNVLRGIVPYLIYITAFGAILYLPFEKRLELLRWYVIVAALMALKTFLILAYNGVTPSDILRGVRATFFDINSGLAISMTAIPLVFVCFEKTKTKILLLTLLVGQIIVGQSKSLMMATLFFLGVFFILYKPQSQSLAIQTVSRFSKLLLIFIFIALLALTIQKNPLLQRFILMVQNPKTELSGRIYEVKNVIASIEQNPLLGRGQGYVFIHKAADSPDDNPRFEERRYTHSVLFYHLSIMGFLGMPFALLMLHGPAFYMAASTFSSSLKRKRSKDKERNKRDKELWLYFLPLTLSGLGLFAFNMVSASYKNPQSLIFLGLLNAIILTIVYTRSSPQKYSDKPQLQPTHESS